MWYYLYFFKSSNWPISFGTMQPIRTYYAMHFGLNYAKITQDIS